METNKNHQAKYYEQQWHDFPKHSFVFNFYLCKKEEKIFIVKPRMGVHVYAKKKKKYEAKNFTFFSSAPEFIYF